jgi:hypothetical protein
LIVLSSYHIVQASHPNSFPLQSSFNTKDNILPLVYLPIIYKPPLILPILNIPYFEGSDVNYHEAAVSWFGQVRNFDNYADIRVGYNSDEIYVRLSVFDRFLWDDVTPDIYNLTEWDSVTLYLDLNGNNGSELDPTMFRFTAQLETTPQHTDRQIVYQGSSSGWNQVPLTFYTSSGWKGGLNDSVEDRGYVLTFHIPFDSLGYPSRPSDGTKWGAALTLHDRDDADGITLSEKYWPQEFNPARSASWGQFSFGLPTYTPPQISNPQVFTIRNGQNGAHVIDGVVGGNTVCGQGLDFWWQWGDHTYYPPTQDMNVQNQGNIDDWPCYSKFYITFPLDSLPAGKMVISATLTLYQSGQSEGFPEDPPEALNSLIQVSVIAQDWDETTLTWNNGPIPVENVSQSWVGYLPQNEWGKAYTWDLSRAIVSAYESGQPLRLVVYSADTYGPNGKYFLTSDTLDYSRPYLSVELGDQYK